MLESLCTPRFLIGMSVFRIIAGTTIAYQFLMHYAQRSFLWGPDGVYPLIPGSRTAIPLLSWSRSQLYFEFIFHIALILSILWLLGVYTRVLTPLLMVVWRAFADRNPLLGDGGDNLMALLLLYVCFADISAHLSVDARWRAKAVRSPFQENIKGLFHNAALIAVGAQLCLLYAVAGLTKVQGEFWRDGTAISYAFRTADYTWPGMSELIYSRPALFTVLSYATVAFQISFPFCLVLNAYSRRAILMCAFLFHLGIACFMGLVTFTLFMISADMIFLRDDEYQRVFNRLQRGAKRFVLPQDARKQ